MRLYLIGCLLTLVSVAQVWAGGPEGAGARYNVLLIMADDLRPELGCYGALAKTPHLDRLALRGIRFQGAYCQQALCNPSRASMLTGRRPDSLHLWNNGTHFRERNPSVVTLPEWFKKHGYHTRCVGKIFHNWHTRQKGDRQSWSADEFLHYANHGDDVPAVEGPLPPNLVAGIGRLYGKVPVTECRDVPDEAYYDGRVAAEAARVLAEIKEQPFFLAVGFWKPHAPFNAPKRYWDLYRRDEFVPRSVARPANAPEIAFHDSREILGIPPNQVSPTDEQSLEMRHGYFANISYMDAQVGKLLRALDEHQLASRTVIVFVSDHGYHIGEHGLWGKTSCFEWDARVPLIIALPGGISGGKVTTHLVELIDLFPTLVDLCGLPAPEGLDGVSLLPLLDDPSHAVKKAAFTQHPRPAYFDRTPTAIPEAMGYSVRTPSGRYTEWRAWDSGKLLAVEYYDHQNDPYELNNVAASADAAIREARQLLHEAFPPHIAPSRR